MAHSRFSVMFPHRRPSGSSMGLLSSPTLSRGEQVEPMVDDGQLEALVAQDAEGDAASWPALLGRIGHLRSRRRLRGESA